MAGPGYSPVAVKNAGEEVTRLKGVVVKKDDKIEELENKVITQKESTKKAVERTERNAMLATGVAGATGVGWLYVNNRYGQEDATLKFGKVPADFIAGTLLTAAGVYFRKRKGSEILYGAGIGSLAAMAGRMVVEKAVDQRREADGLPPLQHQLPGTHTAQQLGAARPAAPHWDGQTLTVAGNP